ncbi:MAG: GNAT family N-acetyltransferase [Bacteroidia bacterium]
MNTITIREYKPTDRKACVAIFNGNVPKFFTDGEFEQFNTWLNAEDKASVAYSNAREQDYFVAILDGKIVGCGGFYIYRDEKIAKMAWGMVESPMHKQGIGKALLVHRINSIENLFPGYTISVDTTQHSFEFFEKLGFKTTKITKDFYNHGLDRYDMVLE